MATLTDEEKAKLVAGDVEENTPVEPTTEPEAPSEPVEEPAAEEEAEPPKEEEAEPEATFTKQFPNLKGESPEEYAKELESAYVNSSNEALRLKRELDDLKAAGKQPDAPAADAPVTPAPTVTDPNVQYAKQLRDRDMVSAFDEFTKQYPQARETEEFNKFTAASDGVAQGYEASHGGMQPTFPELFNGIAAVLGWQPLNPRKDATIKETASSSQVTSSTQPTARQPKVSDAQVDAYLKMFTSKTRAEAIKELSEVV